MEYQVKMVPETLADVVYLRERFPHLDGESVCIAKLLKSAPVVSLWRIAK